MVSSLMGLNRNLSWIHVSQTDKCWCSYICNLFFDGDHLLYFQADSLEDVAVVIFTSKLQYLEQRFPQEIIL